MNQTKTKKISLLEIVLWFIVIASSLGIASLVLGIFKPFIVLIGSLAIIVGFMTLQNYNMQLNVTKNQLYQLIFLMLLALFFRVNSEQYIMGGQDEGVYVNMSKYFENYGQVFPKDNFRISLNTDLKNIYDKNNLETETMKYVNDSTKIGIKVLGKMEGVYLPGIYIKDLDSSQYVFQFYHLHPLWMALFGDIFGGEKRQLSLLFFALLSIVIFYLIIYKVTNNNFYSLAGGALLASNPLHAYFTKFPVTEVMALCFSLSGFYFLLLFYKTFEEDGVKVYRYLVLSGLIFGSLFFIRIHGFMYIPFFYTLFILSLVSTSMIKKELILYFLGIFLLYASSVYYGYVYSYPYIADIYRISFSKVFGENWNQILIIVIIAMAVFPLMIANLTPLKIFTMKLKGFIKQYFYILFLIVLALGIYKIYQLGFTEKYLNHHSLGAHWKIAGSGFNAILHSSLIVLIEHISLILFIVFLFAIKMYDRKNIYMNTLLLFIFGFWVYGLLLQYVTRYQYYYARYLLSELIPYILLFATIYLSTIKFQKLSKILLVISMVYFIAISLIQLQGTESKGAYSSLNKISNIVQKDDFLLVSNMHLSTKFPMEIKTTLKYYYDLNVFSYKNIQLNGIINSLATQFQNDIYILTTDNLNYDFVKKIKTVNVSIETSNYIRNISPLVKYKNNVKSYNFYKIDLRAFFISLQTYEGIVYKRDGYLENRRNFNDKVWTKKNSKIINLFFTVRNEKYLKLSTFGWNPNRGKLDKLNLKLKINGEKIKLLKFLGNNYYFSLPTNLRIIYEIEISSNTFNPKKMGKNNDDRNLGIDIKEIKLIKDLPQ